MATADKSSKSRPTISKPVTTKKSPKPEIINSLGDPTKCLRCSKTYKQQKSFFSPSYSKVYYGNNGFLPVCRDCIDVMFKEYIDLYENDQPKAFRRICMIFDIYYNDELFHLAKGSKGISFLLGSYFSRLNNTQYLRSETREHKNYDDTIKEEDAAEDNCKINDDGDLIESIEAKDIKVPQKSVKFWGYGYDPAEYKRLDDDYASWIIRANNGETPSKSLENALREMCKTAVDITRARKDKAKATDISALQTTYIKWMERAGVSPDQENSTSMAEKNALGVLIDVWETSEPVPKYPEENIIKKYIQNWFKGGLAKTANLKNDTEEEYRAELEKFKIKIFEEDQEEIPVNIEDIGVDNG